ncbi:autotransporter assembly complex protein TamA [Qipengyuania sp. CAU 1752]
MRAGCSLVALLVATLATPVWAQDEDTPEEQAAELLVPEPPTDVILPEIEQIISDEEFEASIPELDPDSDPALDMPLESIAEFERRLAAEEADAEPGEGQEPPLGEPALADGDLVEEIGDAPIRDAELIAPLPPLDQFEVEPVEFAEDASDAEIVEVGYTVLIEGLEDANAEADVDLRDMFNDLSALETGDGKAANVAQVLARLKEDSILIERLLASEGWYEAQIETRVDRSSNPDEPSLTAVIQVAPGRRYTFSEITIEADPVEPPDLIRDNFALEVGQPIIAMRVQGAEAQVAVALPENGYPFATIGQRDILLDPETGDGSYTLPVAVGTRARFGGFRTTGDLAFDADHVAVLAQFKQGELYDSRMVDDLRQALVATGLLNTISVQPEETGEDAGDGTEYVTIVVDQAAAPPRTIAATAGYGTGEGFRVEGSWSHRNLFPPEGALTARGVLGTREQGAGLIFRRSNAGKRDRAFLVVAEALRSDYDAYEAFTGRLSALMTYESTSIWRKPLTYAVGARLIGTNEQDYDFALGDLDRRTFFIGGLIGQLGVDQTDSLLNATKGFRITALVEPEGALHDGFVPYVRARLDGSAYFSPTDAITLAGRLAAGTIQGIERFELAPSRRFYAGGGGSVRGFGYQEVGPRVVLDNPKFDPTDPDETANPFIYRPIGGRSFNEASLEVRYRFGDFGVVGFVDAGQVYESDTPDGSDLRFGAGIGGRYYTNFGPLRFDLAMPLDRREGESSFAIYVSIGQAF